MARARQDLAALIHEAERGATVEVTRRGRAVAVLVSAGRLRRLGRGRAGFWTALESFGRTTDLGGLRLDDAFSAGLRDRDPGRKVTW